MPSPRANRRHEQEARRMAALSPVPADRARFLAIAEQARERAEALEARDDKAASADTAKASAPPPSAGAPTRERSWLSRLWRKRS